MSRAAAAPRPPSSPSPGTRRTGLGASLLLAVALVAGDPAGAQTAASPAAPAGSLDAAELARTVDAALALVEDEFVVRHSREELVGRALNLLLQDLDPYSRYLDPGEREEFEAQVDAVFGGVGVVLEVDATAGVPRVEQLLVDSPAADAGVLAGDLLLAIDGQTLAGWPLERVTPLLRGAPGSPVELRVRRGAEGAEHTFRPVRRPIALPSVHGASRDAAARPGFLLPVDGPVGYVRIERLASDSEAAVAAALAAIERAGARGLVLDLRECVGGRLEAAVAIADLFLDEGVVVTVQQRGEPDVRSATPGVATRLPLAVLIDAGTASSCEILAGALRDHERGVFVGQRTFGKGRVQVHRPLGDGLGSIVLTTGTFQRPSGRTIDRHDVPEGSPEAGVAPHEGLAIELGEAELAAWRESVAALAVPIRTGEPVALAAATDRVLQAGLAALARQPAVAAQPASGQGH